jgi:hypothetical protein
MSVPPIAFVYAYGAAWIAEHLAEVAIVSATCGALAVAAVVALMRWSERRQARHAAEHPIWTVREVPWLSDTQPSKMPPAGHREFGTPAVHLHFHGAAEAGQAEIALHAINGGP